MDVGAISWHLFIKELLPWNWLGERRDMVYTVRWLEQQTESIVLAGTPVCLLALRAALEGIFLTSKPPPICMETVAREWPGRAHPNLAFEKEHLLRNTELLIPRLIWRTRSVGWILTLTYVTINQNARWGSWLRWVNNSHFKQQRQA